MVYPCGVYRGFVEFMGHPVYNPISRLFWVMEIMKLGNRSRRMYNNLPEYSTEI